VKALALLALLQLGAPVTEDSTEDAPRGLPNLALPTLGGVQLWTDVLWRSDWHVQRHAWTGHHRLLDPRGRRRAWGSLAACRAALERVPAAAERGDRAGELVILVHGLGRSHHAMRRLERAVERTGRRAFAFTYASTRGSLAEHAAALTGVLDGLADVRRVSFVTHSLGGLVVRTALAGDAAWRASIELGRLVMLAPPSRGSSLAERLRHFAPFRWIAGPAGVEASTSGAPAIPVPDCEFGVVAGGRGRSDGWNPLLEGDDDGILSVAETRLEGAADTRVVEGFHTWLMDRPEAVAATLRFLDDGRFADDGEAAPARAAR